MVSTTSKSDSKQEAKQTLNSKNPKNVYQIGGLQVEFPYQPYGTQLAFMSRVISTLDRAQRDGHCHALLESPTGTGKSLSLLCSVLAWQQNYKSRLLKGNLSHSKPAPEAATDPLNHGGGFIPETQPSDTPLPSNVEPAETAAKKRTKIPTIYYASRTHSQITQVIREYRKTGYRVPMAVLASRKHYCTNQHGKENVDEECRLLLKDKANIQCSEFKNVSKITAHPSLQQRGHNEVHDIEDLVKVGKNVRGCPYYAAWSMAENAQLVFCPYSYIVNPVIRAGVEVDLKGAIIIFDEAHNMEDIAREAGSINLEEETLFKLQNELEQMSVAQPMIYQPLCEVVEGLISWIGRKKDSLEKRDFQHYFSSWTGDKALRELEESNITRECFPILLECFTKAIRTSKEAEMEPDMPHLSGISVLTLEELFASLTYFFSRNGSHILDYQLGLQRSTKRGDSSGAWTHTFSLWCMNPSVVFKDLADLSLSIILTSGTLSPMNSFSSELGMQFGTCLEAPHVIDVNLQVWAGAISNGPGNYPLNGSYKTADAYSFQDALGKSLEEICTIVPGGSLVFFPSYKLMEKLSTRWRETGQWSRLCLKKDLFVEPRGGAQDEFDSVLKGYYDSIRGKNRLIGRNRRAKKAGPVKTEAQDDSKKGAAFLAVCRGKVSEGIDFADDNARAVIIVGIPFPNMHDIQVGLKKKYNDTYKSSKNLLGGSDWYCQQAYRALNQAAGRCIRHRFDYGAIIFLDERYKEQRNRASISKWLRQSIKLYDNFEESMQGLTSFFNSAKERVDSKMLGSQDYTVEQNFSSENQSKECKRMENQIQKKSSHAEPKDITGRKVMDVEDYTSVNPNYPSMNESKEFLDHKDGKPKIAEGSRSMQLSGGNYGTSISHLSSPGDIPAQTFIQVKEEAKCYKEVIDLEPGVQPEPGFCEVSSVTNCDEDPETSFVKKTSRMIKGISAASPCSCSKNESSSPVTGLRSPRSPDQFLKQHTSTGNLRRSPIEAESPLNMSVNSHALKRRKFTGSPVIDLEDENSNAPRTRPMDHTGFTRRMEFEFGSTESRSQIDNIYAFPEMNQRVMRISCSLCRSSLGHPENHSYPKCLLTSSSKTYLLSLLKETLGTGSAEMPTSVSVVMTDCSLVNPRLCRSFESSKGQGIWCEQDGCVFNTIFCPFCSIPNTCLGVQVMATDSSNVQFLSKILLFADQVDVTEDAASKETALKHKGPLAVTNTTDVDKSDAFKSIERFAYSAKQQQDSGGGWRSTKSKVWKDNNSHSVETTKKQFANKQEVLEKMFSRIKQAKPGLISWIGRRKDSLVKRDSEHYFSVWSGDKALRELKECNITRECLECFNQAITNSEAAEMEPDMPCLSGISVTTLKELHTTLTYFFSRNGSHILDYELCLQRSIKRGDSSRTWTHTFSLWCMNPSVVFKDLADLSLSIILTSGTLSPMNSFSSELGMQFGTCLEAPHVIDANLQVWAGAISNGPANFPLNASYKTADAYSFQDTLGKSLEEICTIVPDGSLIFFPSYKLMEKLSTRWRETGQWSRLCLKKEVFVEPRGEAKDEFDSVLKGYYDCIRGKNRLVGRRVNKAGAVMTEARNDSKKGAAFLAVCRGKVSEGLDFSDDNARAVIIVGIPFPNLHDVLVELKRKYNDTHKSSKNLLGGSEWYCQQAYRALNQAAGRCIRHRFDYGAIIFLDERYRQPRNRVSISKWLRQSIKLYDNFEESMKGLTSFFNSVKERVGSKVLASQENQSKDCKRNENQIQNKSAQTLIQVKEEAKCCKEVIDLECSVKPELGCCEGSSVTNCDEDSETSFVKETSAKISAASSCSCSKNESFSPATGLRSLRSPDQFLKRHISTETFRRSPLGAESSSVVTPERYSIGDTNNSTLEAESPLNKSVNSHALKRRKFTSSPVIDLEEENSNAPSTSFTRRIEFGSTESRSQNDNTYAFPEVDQREMRISCSLCKSPLGHPESHSYLSCSLTSSSKTYLLSLLKETSGTGSAETPTSVSVVMTYSSMVDQRLCTSLEGSKGIWCEQDGCVFNSIFCPFCSIPNTCLGVQVMATDSSNVQLLRKILFFADQVDVTKL